MSDTNEEAFGPPLPPALTATIPADPNAPPTTMAFPQNRWWERWWDPKTPLTVDLAKLKGLLGEDFDATKTMNDYIKKGAPSETIMMAAFGPPRGKEAGPYLTILVKRGWLFDDPVLLQKLDPTYALGVILKIKPLRDLARRGIPIAAYTRKLPDDLVKQISDFRKSSIPHVENLKTRKPEMKLEDARLAVAQAKAKQATQENQADEAYVLQLVKEAHDDSQEQADALAAREAAEAKLKAAVAARAAAEKNLNAGKAQDKRKHDGTTDAGDAAQANLAQAQADQQTAKNELTDAQNRLTQRENLGMAAGFVLGGGDKAWSKEQYKIRFDAAPTLREKRIAECYAPENAIPDREGAPSSINTWDGTFTYGGGWNMTTGDGAHIPKKLVDPKGAEGFRVGCRVILDYFQKSGMWFDGTLQLLLHEKETSGEPKLMVVHEDDDNKSAYIVTGHQVAQVGSKMGSSFKYLSRNRKLMEAWSTAGQKDMVPDQPVPPSKDACMPARDVMYELQYQLFADLRMANFNVLWNVCFTQAAFFFLTHMNHFGGAYAQEAVIAFGVTNGIVPTEPSDPKDAGLVEISPGKSLRRCFATDIKMVRAGLSFMAKKGRYGTKTLGPGWEAYKTLWSNFVSDITRGNSALGEAPYTPTPPASSTAAPASSTWASAADVSLPSPDATEAYPLKPWLLSIEDVTASLKDDAAKATWRKELTETWYIVPGDSTSGGWQRSTYLVLKRPPEAPKVAAKTSAKSKKTT